MPTDLAHWAAWYAMRGLHVFPCGTRAKTPITPRGCRDATTDRRQIAAWWAQHPRANIGLCAGPSGLAVVDVDGDDGVAALQRYLVPTTWVARTRRGWHLLFRAPEGAELGPRTALLPSVDVRAGYSYIIAPPSVHPSGHTYRWARGRRPGELALADAPDWLLELMRRPEPELADHEPAPYDLDRDTAYARAVLDGECARVAQAAPGSRNGTLNAAAWAIGRRVAVGLIDARTARDRLIAAAIEAGLSRREAMRTASSGMSSGMQLPKPRPVTSRSREVRA